MTEASTSKAIYKLTADISQTPVSKFMVRVFFDSKTRSSFCWRYFGNLLLVEGNKKKIINSDQVYCSLCLDLAKAERQHVTFGLARIKYYNMTVSTGNLMRHLRDTHQIYDARDDHPARPDAHSPGRLHRKTSTSTVAVLDHFELAKDLAILCCRSLIPFDSICHEVVGDFLTKYNVIRHEDLPSQHTVSGEALTHVYDVTCHNVKTAILHDSPRHAAVTVHLWTDVCRKLDYAMLSLHYLTNVFEMKSFNLSTLNITSKTTTEKEERLKSMIEDVLQSFELTAKNIDAVSAAGAVESRAISLLNIPQHLCLADGLQNLISDGIHEVHEINELINKFVTIVKVVVQNINYIEPEDETEQELLDSLCEIVDGLHHELIDNENNISLVIETPCLNPIEDNITEIKMEPVVSKDEEIKGPSIHWCNILKMAEKLVQQTGHQDIINNMLMKLAQVDIMVISSEWLLLEEIVKILAKLKEAMSIISSQICTINIALVFRSEIIDILNTNSDDYSVLALRLKRSMLSNINRRIPVSRAMVAAALLDCRFMALKEVDSYLESQNLTRAAFLATSIRGCISDDEIPEIKPIPSSSSTSPSQDSSILVKLSQKHRGASLTVQDDPIEQECWRYLASADPTDPKDEDLLSFWNSRQEMFPRLSVFAKAVLCIPATSAPCDNVFDGNALGATRSRMHPTRINKVMFIHSNYKYYDPPTTDAAT